MSVKVADLDQLRIETVQRGGILDFDSRPEPLDKIRGLVFGYVLADAETQQVLKDRVNGS